MAKTDNNKCVITNAFYTIRDPFSLIFVRIASNGYHHLLLLTQYYYSTKLTEWCGLTTILTIKKVNGISNTVHVKRIKHSITTSTLTRVKFLGINF